MLFGFPFDSAVWCLIQRINFYKVKHLQGNNIVVFHKTGLLLFKTMHHKNHMAKKSLDPFYPYYYIKLCESK